MDTGNAKVIALIGVMFGGIMWWFYSGNEFILQNARFDAFLQTYRGHSVFSVRSVALWFLVLSVLLYPPVIWFCVCMTAFDPSMARQTLFSRGFLAVWFFPVTFTLLVGFMLSIWILARLAAWLWFFGTFGFLMYIVVSAALRGVRRK